MKADILKIKDECRENLSKYTLKAFSCIPEIENPVILDMGCGTGVPALALAQNCDGVIYAVDPDLSAINRLREKVFARNFTDRIKIFHDSVFNPHLFNIKFDIVIAEGLLNVTGFKEGLPLLLKYLKNDGYLIIHDELKDDNEKRLVFNSYNLKMIESFQLDEKIWWSEYFECLEKKIKNFNDDWQFATEIKEINECRTNPENYRSVYYILKR